MKIDGGQALMLSAYVSGAHHTFGAAGHTALTALFDAVRKIYAARPPELISCSLTVLAPIDHSTVDALTGAHGSVESAASAEDIASIMAANIQNGVVVGIAADLTYRVAVTGAPVNPKVPASSAVVYHREAGIERILVGVRDDVVPRLSEVSVSNFAEPTFSGLEAMLDRYEALASESTCQVLATVWQGGVDGPRLVLVNRPEHVMRESLFDTLSKTLRKAHVTREHMTDARKPVDIHVDWIGSPAEALIEIKWIGKSMKPADKVGLFGFPESRAQEGANQLADYLDRKRSSSLNHARIGYLVVYDARRNNVKDPATPLSKKDALAFEKADLAYAPDHAENRTDFAQPRRWFLRPRESCFLDAA
jgi:hypothetical protein